MKQLGRRKAPEDDVGSDEIHNNAPAVLQALNVALIISCLQYQLCSEEMIVSEVVSTQVVEKADTLRSGKASQWRRLLVNIAKDLFCAPQLAAVEEEFQTDVGTEVDSDSSAFRSSRRCETG